MKGPKTVGDTATIAPRYSPSTEKKPSYAQLFRLVAQLCERAELDVPKNRAEASQLIDQMKAG